MSGDQTEIGTSGGGTRWSELVEKIQSMVLNFSDKSVGSVKIADTANPVNWSRLAQVIVGTFVTLGIFGYSAIQQAFATLWSAPFRAGASFLEDLIDASIGTANETIRLAAETTSMSVETMGSFAFAVAVASVLAALYLTSRGVNRID